MKIKTMFGLVMLAILIVAVPLVIAKGQGVNGAGPTGNAIRVNNDNGNSIDDNDIDNDNDIDDDINNENNDDSNGNLRAGNVDDCIRNLMANNSNLTGSEARLRNACVVALRTEKVNEIKEQVRERIDEKRAEIAQKIMEKREEQNRVIKNVILKEFAKKREIVKEKLQEAEQRFQKAKDSYENNKQKHEMVRNEFRNLKHEYNQCVIGNNTNSTMNCTDYEERLLEKAKEDLLALADRLIDHLEKVKSRVKGAENINETEAEDSIAKIDDFIEQLEDAKEIVEDADTKEELKEASDEIRAIWNSIDFDVFNFAERVINSRVGEIYARSRALESQLAKVLERLEAKGINTTELTNLTDSFREHLDNAKDYMDSANEKFAEAKEVRDGNLTNSTAEAKALLEEGKQLTRDAHNELKEAHKVLMDLVKMINQRGESFDPDGINDDDEVEISEPEED